ncbi:MAG: PfkB family carbohydrate kinase, partial [Pseudomonadota bacterium]|nr:PfkB family carbohydrate kinase [Pseudomonadota bacterium]
MTTSLTDLTPHLDKLTGRKVLCIGDVMLDRFVRGEVSRLSPEAPIPVLLEETEEHMLGGAANTAANAAALGADVYLIAVIGKDRPGQTLKRLVREHIGAEDGLIEDSRRKTEIKTRYLTRNQQLLRVDKSPRLPPADESRNQLLADVRAHLQSSKAVIISDYGKGMLEPSEVATIIAEARKAGVPVIVDPKGSDYNRYRGASVITPNRDELTAATGKEARDDAEIEKAAHDLTARFDIDTVLVTRSEDGVSIVPGKGDSVHLPTLARDVFDVSGAGDTVVAMLAVA